MKISLTPHEQFVLAVFLFKNFQAMGATESLQFADLTEQMIPELTEEFLVTQKTTIAQLCPHCLKPLTEPIHPSKQPPIEVDISPETADFLGALLNRYQRTPDQAIILARIERRITKVRETEDATEGNA